MDDCSESPACVQPLPESRDGLPENPFLATAVDEPPPLRWREAIVVGLVMTLCDLTIYRGHGLTGYALLFFAMPWLLTIGSPRPKRGVGFWIVGGMLMFLAAKLLWCGAPWLVAVGFTLVVAFAATLSGQCPYVIEVVVFASQTIVAGYEGLIHHWRCLDKHGPQMQRGKWWNFVLPLLAVFVFGLLFILANPNLVASFSKWLEWLGNVLRDWIERFSPDIWEMLFLIAVLWIAVGLLRPVIRRLPLFETLTKNGPESPSPAPLYAAFRNMLLAVIVLFAAYLVFEFKTLWFREFPKGFYYSGYAHEGAAWLTVALALATVVLSMVFRGSILHDPRLCKLRRLAWLWSFENLLLASAVYHRMFIYIDFNGMTRMRMVGIFGMSAVVAGFVFVIWKILYNRDFVWLMRRHLWTLAVAVYLFAITPVDMIVTHYNVNRILAGDLAPSVQIIAHPISAEGVLLLQPLLKCDDKTIRDGIRALLAKHQGEAECFAADREKLGWTKIQLADYILLQSLTDSGAKWSEYTRDSVQRDEALRKYYDYAYQWY